VNLLATSESKRRSLAVLEINISKDSCVVVPFNIEEDPGLHVSYIKRKLPGYLKKALL